MMRCNKAFILLAVVWLAGCAFPSRMPAALYYRHSPQDVIIVGKFELDPQMDVEHEQDTRWNVIGDGAILNHVVMATASAPSDEHPESFPLSAWKNHINAEWGETFVLAAPRERVYLNGGMMQLDITTGSRVYFPGGVYFEAPTGATAIYIGTLKYTRGDFFAIKTMQVLDEYAEASKVLKEKFGESARLSKALMRPAH